MFVETFQVAVKKLIAFIKEKAWTTKKGEGFFERERELREYVSGALFLLKCLFVNRSGETAIHISVRLVSIISFNLLWKIVQSMKRLELPSFHLLDCIM